MLTIRRMNINTTHDKSFVMDRPNGIDCYLLLIVKAPACFWIKGRLVDVNPNSAILFTPKTKQYYKPLGDVYVNDWMHIEDNDNLIESLELPYNEPFEISNEHNVNRLFKMICEEYYFNKKYKKEIIDSLVRTLLYSLCETDKTNINTQIHKSLIKIRQEIYDYPAHKWNVNIMADKVNLSTGYFQYVYKLTFGITPAADVIQSRINIAKMFLLESDFSVKEIAYMSGYDNDVHFLRQFKKIVGKTPTEFRKKVTRV